jgi:hypothetical protein
VAADVGTVEEMLELAEKVGQGSVWQASALASGLVLSCLVVSASWLPSFCPSVLAAAAAAPHIAHCIALGCAWVVEQS